MAEPVIHARDLGRRYGGRWALGRVDLDLEPGERLLLMGQNGGGKTTLLRVLSTLVAPSRGVLRIFGLDPAREPNRIRRRLALLSHLPSLYEDLSGPDNLQVVARLLGRPGDPTPWLERVGLEPRPDPVHTYSAGMRKRLSFARLLLKEPDLALIDEPYGQLDPAGHAMVDALLRDMAERGTTVIVASHLVDRACVLCGRALLLHEGLPRWSGPSDRAPRAWSAFHAEAPASGGAA